MRRNHRPLWTAVALIALVVFVSSPSQHARAQERESGAAVLREAYTALLDSYVDPLSPAALLAEAWLGISAALAAEGVSAPPPPLPDDRTGAWLAFQAAFRELEAAARGTATPRALAYAGIRAMTAARDECHTYFLTPEAMRDFQSSLAGRQEFTGIGIRGATTAPYTILSVIPESPAERAGLLPGDVVAAVDGTPTLGLTAREVSPLIRGSRDTAVTLRIQRPGETEPREVTLIRAPVVIPTVIARLLPDGIGYVELTIFTLHSESADHLRAALLDLEAQGATSWVLDLRRNGGGGVESIREVLGLFLPPTRVAAVVSRGGREQIVQTRGEPLPVQRPMTVLIGEGSASAAEITAAVLQDTGRARLFGERTAGCVNIGDLRDLTDGSGLLVTSARILTGPSRRVLNAAGLAPDERHPAYVAPDAALAAATAYLRQPAVR